MTTHLSAFLEPLTAESNNIYHKTCRIFSQLHYILDVHQENSRKYSLKGLLEEWTEPEPACMADVQEGRQSESGAVAWVL